MDDRFNDVDIVRIKMSTGDYVEFVPISKLEAAEEIITERERTIGLLKYRPEVLIGRAKWQPIDTAPKDGTKIIVAKVDSTPEFPDRPSLPIHMWWASSGFWRRGHWTDGIERLVLPTHWIPEPAIIESKS